MSKKIRASVVGIVMAAVLAVVSGCQGVRSSVPSKQVVGIEVQAAFETLRSAVR